VAGTACLSSMLATRSRSGRAIYIAVVMAVPLVAAHVHRPHVITAGDIMDQSAAAESSRSQLSGQYEVVTKGTVVDTKLGVSGTVTMWQDARGQQTLTTWNDGLDYRLIVDGDTVIVDQGEIGGVRDRRVLAGAERKQHLLDATRDN